MKKYIKKTWVTYDFDEDDIKDILSYLESCEDDVFADLLSEAKKSVLAEVDLDYKTTFYARDKGGVFQVTFDKELFS